MPHPEGDASGYHFTDTASLPWRPSTVVNGVEVKDLGTANGRVMELVRCRPGTTFPTHRHVGPEFLYLLEGEAIQNGQRLRPGWAAVATAGTIDADFHSETGCVFLLIYGEEHCVTQRRREGRKRSGPQREPYCHDDSPPDAQS